MSHRVFELFGRATGQPQATKWRPLVQQQRCPFICRKCIKVRKSQPHVSIGTCSVLYGKERAPTIICPLRLLERRQLFTDAIHLLTLHEPGNELHVVPEVSVPGGSVDYFLVSARRGKPIDFVGVELQTLDTTGTVWPERERFLASVGLRVDRDALKSSKTFGMNWKMTAKTILVQLHHKVSTFEHVSRHLVLAVQDCLMSYMRRQFSFGHLGHPKSGDSLHLHVYALGVNEGEHRLRLAERSSTSAAGVATALGLQAEANVELEVILADLGRKMSDRTLWTPA